MNENKQDARTEPAQDDDPCAGLVVSERTAAWLAQFTPAERRRICDAVRELRDIFARQ